jgi:excisionase family DNA binding protein
MKDYSDVYLTPEQVAKKLRLNVETVYRWLRSRKLRGSRISHKAWRVPERELASFIRQQNVSELLFEEYVDEFELGPLEHEPPYPPATRSIDYRLSHKGQWLWFEVKEFADDPNLTDSGGGAFDPHVGIRAKISKAAAKFRDYDGECCSLVLFNERFNLVDICTPRIVLGAMLGSVGFSIPMNLETGEQVGPVTNFFGDGGKLIHPHVRTPQNTTISAVIALERFAIGQKEHQIAVEKKEIAEQRSLSLEEHLAMSKANPTAYARQVLRAIVYENPHAKKPLPPDIFTGPFDERWGQSGDYIKRIFIGPELERLNNVEHELGLDGSPFLRHAKRQRLPDPLKSRAEANSPEQSIEEFKRLSGQGHSKGQRLNRDQIHDRS